MAHCNPAFSPFVMRPAARPPYLPSLLFPFSAFQHFSFYPSPFLELAKRQPRGKPLVRGKIHGVLPKFRPPLLRQRTQHLPLRKLLSAFWEVLHTVPF